MIHGNVCGRKTSCLLVIAMQLNVNIRSPISRQSEVDFIVQVLVDVVVPSAFADEVDFDGLDGLDLVTDFESASSLPSHDSVSDSPEISGSSDALDDDGLGYDSQGLGSEDERELGEELDPEFVVGRIWGERLDWSYAEACGYSNLEVCDAASGTWMQVFETLSSSGGDRFRRELNLDGFVSEIVFIHEILLHPEIVDRVAVLDAVFRSISTDNSLLLLYHEQSEPHHLEDWEFRDLGFKKIARSNLLLKDNHFRYPFGDEHPAGKTVEFVATAEHEHWLLENWDQLIADHPAL